MVEGKPEGAAGPAGRRSPVARDVSRVGREVAEKARKAGQAAATRVARAGKTARELGAGVQKQVKQVGQEFAPAAAKAKTGLKQARQGLGKALQATARVTRKSARILGLKAQIAAAVRKRQRLYGQIGETYFKLQKRKGAVPGEDKALAELVKSAEAANREIRQLEAKENLERASS
jgi:hypothetical protein